MLAELVAPADAQVVGGVARELRERVLDVVGHDARAHVVGVGADLEAVGKRDDRPGRPAVARRDREPVPVEVRERVALERDVVVGVAAVELEPVRRAHAARDLDAAVSHAVEVHVHARQERRERVRREGVQEDLVRDVHLVEGEVERHPLGSHLDARLVAVRRLGRAPARSRRCRTPRRNSGSGSPARTRRTPRPAPRGATSGPPSATTPRARCGTTRRGRRPRRGSGRRRSGPRRRGSRRPSG